MGKRQTTICTHCGKESCDGIIYKIPARYFVEWTDQYFKRWRGCKNDRWLVTREGQLQFHLVVGHGNESYFDLEAI